MQINGHDFVQTAHTPKWQCATCNVWYAYSVLSNPSVSVSACPRPTAAPPATASTTHYIAGHALTPVPHTATTYECTCGYWCAFSKINQFPQTIPACTAPATAAPAAAPAPTAPSAGPGTTGHHAFFDLNGKWFCMGCAGDLSRVDQTDVLLGNQALVICQRGGASGPTTFPTPSGTGGAGMSHFFVLDKATRHWHCTVCQANGSDAQWGATPMLMLPAFAASPCGPPITAAMSVPLAAMSSSGDFDWSFPPDGGGEAAPDTVKRCADCRNEWCDYLDAHALAAYPDMCAKCARAAAKEQRAIDTYFNNP